MRVVMRQLLLISLVLLAIAPPAQAATWGEPTHVAEAAASADHEFLTDPAGNALLVYAGPGPEFPLTTRIRAPAGPITDAQRLSTVPIARFDLEVGDDGTAVLAWAERVDGRPSRILAATRAPGEQRFGQPQEVATGDFVATEIDVALGGGDTIVGWQATTTVDQRAVTAFHVSVRESGQSGFGQSARAFESTTSHAIELAADGTGFVVGGTNEGFKTARRNGDGAFLPHDDRTLPSEGGNTGPQLAVSASGRAVVATSSAPEGEGSPEARHALVAEGDTHTGFGALRVVSGPGCRFAHVAISADDRAVVAWNAGNGSRSRVQALVAERGENVDGDLVETISARNVRGEVIAAGRGRVAVAWQRKQGDGRNIEAASSAPGDSFGDARRLQRIGLGSFPEAAASQSGTAWVAWVRFEDPVVVNAAQIYVSNGRVGRVTRVATNAYFGRPFAGPLAPGVGGRMVMEYNDTAAEPEHLDLMGYAGG